MSTTILMSRAEKTVSTSTPRGVESWYGLEAVSSTCGSWVDNSSSEQVACLAEQRHRDAIARILLRPRGFAGSSAPEQDYAAFARLFHEHRLYINRLGESGLISRGLAKLALTIWWRLDASVHGTDLTIPDASPGPNGELLYTWKRGPHYLSLEMADGVAAEFFYQHRESGETWHHEHNPDEQPVPEEVVAKLGLFRAEY